ncbi:DUF4132 domain-containing protein [Streptomyces sp. NBC_01728]|uniref:DUF4132 domain-containing protein n=1 Tax=unclassified Streptomyces TaxID=2593676 RepID=UPI002259C154|nr:MULTISPECIES: DUF4132 domain-containing protein [unclassified Streptomyces]MCX4457618.1 DUF4132 domain-containing protein [Streptomyces sp. NBC_01719]MCX4496975.1 DUF4132 domain-containing protein [Streptomyces sp. NBC_01728]
MFLAARLMRALTDPDFILEDKDRHPDLSQVSDEELGSLLVAAYRVDASATHAMTMVRFAVEDAAGERQPRYTPDACRRMFEALVERCEERGWADLTLGLGALERCTRPLPDVSEPARTLVGFWLEKDTVRQPYALLAVAGIAGDGTLRAVVERLSRDVGPIVADEIAVSAGIAPAERALLSEIDRDHRFVSPLAHAWRRSAENPAYVAFARRALEAAADRTDAIRAGEIPYRADKAFTDREITSLGQALRVALLRDEPWLPELFERLLPGVALAPTAAKTLPSQALLYEVVRAAQDFPTPELVTAIRTVRGTVRHAGVPKQLDKMLKKVDAALAERTDVALRLPRLEFDTPTISGSAAGGVLRRTAGDYQAVVMVTETATLTWEKDGRPLRSVPAPVRRDHAALVKELRDLVKRVNAQLVTLVRALEGGFTVEAVHPYGWWRTELAGHPLARTLVRRLIWEIEVAPGEWRAVLPETDEHLPDAPDDASVRLWHPLRSDPHAVRAWRDLLTERCIRQPFKQAFREIYLLTPAEEQTRVYSNRFAAHIVHYLRMFALFRARGWKSDRLGPWDGGDGDEAERTLAAGEWRVRFFHSWADWAGDDELASTDQVRFDRRVAGAWREAPLADVPPLVFSEAMRDVDLFVGVTSIAADPDWTDGGPERTYWERTGFAELTESAEARRDVLERILPRLKIAGRCTLDGRFLIVRGELRTYKIHLGSANILMQPDDSYLCIVPSRRSGDGKVFLPFEDDRLSLILSKAFLLAADTEITDESILTQIKRGA